MVRKITKKRKKNQNRPVCPECKNKGFHELKAGLFMVPCTTCRRMKREEDEARKLREEKEAEKRFLEAERLADEEKRLKDEREPELVNGIDIS